MTKKKSIFEVDADINLFKQGTATGNHEKLSGIRSSTTIAASKKDGRDLESVFTWNSLGRLQM